MRLNPRQNGWCLGRFYIEKTLIENGEIADYLAKMQFVPIKVEFIPYKDQYEYIGLSPKFSLIEFGQEPPLYEVSIRIEEDGDFIEVEIQQVKI
jgi:hypothetical protein